MSDSECENKEISKPFRFIIMGAANIARKFCAAVQLIENCEVTAVASKSMERAQAFAQKNNIHGAYGSYRKILEEEKPDCAYIAVTTNAHYELAVLCLEYGIPVLCEKAMFTDSAQAKHVFRLAAEKNLFVMEAMWSRFLPVIQKAREWVESGKIGEPGLLDIGIGFAAPPDEKNRYFNPELGGGAAYDLLVYAFELAVYFTGMNILEIQSSVIWSKSGIDLTEQVSLRFETMLASLKATLGFSMEERLVIYGDKGKIVVPVPHFGSEAFLYGKGENGQQYSEQFKDTETKNGFVYEIQEVIRCINANLIESPVVPHALTLECAKLFDKILTRS